jgi:hypothetical protein
MMASKFSAVKAVGAAATDAVTFVMMASKFSAVKAVGAAATDAV